jgi:hypothetical protein
VATLADLFALSSARSQQQTQRRQEDTRQRGHVTSIRHDDALLSLSASFVLYFAAAFAVTELGHFPVPVMGTGAGHILGWYSASGILAALTWPRDTRVPIAART